MEQPVATLELRTGYFGDPAAFAALADLLRDTFDIDIRLLDRFGGPNPAAMPSGYFDAEGRCVASFSAFPMPLVIHGRAVRAVGYQSGAVRPAYRGQGLYRDLMRRTFAWAEAQGFELGILLTDKPALYEPYGFRSVPQHAFRGPVPAAVGAPNARSLSLESPADLDLITRALATRRPTSDVFAVLDRSNMFLLNACFDADIRLSHLPGIDAIVAWKDQGEALQLLDIVATEIPSLAAVAGALAVTKAEITVCFSPDRLHWPEGRAERHAGACDLMIAGRSPFEFPTDCFMLSPMADF